MPSKQDLRALLSLITEAHLILKTTDLPEGRAERACELLASAETLATHLTSVRPAAVLGSKGGKATAKRGPDYFRKIAGMRRTKAGGRPAKP